MKYCSRTLLDNWGFSALVLIDLLEIQEKLKITFKKITKIKYLKIREASRYETWTDSRPVNNILKLATCAWLLYKPVLNDFHIYIKNKVIFNNNSHVNLHIALDIWYLWELLTFLLLYEIWLWNLRKIVGGVIWFDCLWFFFHLLGVP